MRALSPAAISAARVALDRKAAERIAATMRTRGLTLSVSLERPYRRWRLSNGWKISEAVALIVIARPDVTDMADGLFPGTPQTFRVIGGR
jgi:hypothetical protein